jgi:short-subunit dehydrogenase
VKSPGEKIDSQTVNSMTDWSNRVVLITGASSGLGFELVRSFSSAGAKVVLVARNLERLNAVAKELKLVDERFAAISCDITNDADVANMIAQVQARFGQLDVLVNCAGISARGRLSETTIADFQTMWELNILAVVRGTQAALPLLEKTKGTIVNIGSLSSRIGSRYLGAYCTTKHALAGLSQQMRLEFADQGVHVLLICPGPVRRTDAGFRYQDQTANLPSTAGLPGGGVKLKGIAADWLADRIVKACARRERVIIVPGYMRYVFAMNQLSARLGDWFVRKFT